MKPALQVIDLIPHVHRTPALAALRRPVLEGRHVMIRLSDEDRELAFHDVHVQLTSPIGARILKMLHDECHLKLKKLLARSLPILEAYIDTEAVVVIDEGGDGCFEFALEEVVFQQDAVLQGLVPSFDLTLRLGIVRHQHRRDSSA